ncbi:hypothetical protein HYW76_01825 [Candidatus Pacearchaeota archaeon]|nr:hypothetical protein [Candidatus Pacearchaeota archaeon]
MLKLKHKKGWVLGDHVITILFEILVVLGLVYLAILLFGLYSGSQRKDQARSTLNEVTTIISKMSDNTPTKYTIVGTKGYVMASFIEDSSRYEPGKTPYFLCVCEAGKDLKYCQDKNLCNEASFNIVKTKSLYNREGGFGPEIKIYEPFDIYFYTTPDFYFSGDKKTIVAGTKEGIEKQQEIHWMISALVFFGSFEEMSYDILVRGSQNKKEEFSALIRDFFKRKEISNFLLEVSTFDGMSNKILGGTGCGGIASDFDHFNGDFAEFRYVYEEKNFIVRICI